MPTPLPPVGSYDIVLVVDGTGTSTSVYQNTYNIACFSVKAPLNAVWEFDIVDRDSYPVASSDGGIGQLTGNQSIPVERRCAGFFLTLKRATPGTYNIRVNVD